MAVSDREALGRTLADDLSQLLTVIVSGNLPEAEQRDLVALLAATLPDLVPIALFSPAGEDEAPILLSYPKVSARESAFLHPLEIDVPG